MQTTAVVTDLYPALNGTASADLHWWTLDQLFAWLSDALQVLDGAVPVFAVVQSGSTAAARNALSPAGSVAVVAAAWNQSSLRPATVAELEALDPLWESAAAGTPKRWTEDQGPGSIRLYPAPASSGQLQIVHHGSAARFTSAGGDCPIPAALSEFLWYAVLASARKQTGEAWLPEVATAAEAQAAMLLKIAQGYWGSSL